MLNWFSQHIALLSTFFTMLVSAGVAKFMFYSVNKNERGVWLRLGNPIYRRDGTLSVMRNGHPGIRPPWLFHLIKVDVAIRTTPTDDMEMVRRLPSGGRESWKATGEFLWQVKDDAVSYVKAIFSTKDMDATLEQAVKSTVQRTIKDIMRENLVGSMEDSTAIYDAVEVKCRDELDEFGIHLVNTNVFRLRPVDASILRGLLDSDDSSDTPDNELTTKLVSMVQIDSL